MLHPYSSVISLIISRLDQRKYQGRIKGWAQGAGAPGHPPKGDKRGHPPDKSNCTHREMRLLIRAETRTV